MNEHYVSTPKLTKASSLYSFQDMGQGLHININAIGTMLEALEMIDQ
jgi:hypothetical protein